MCSLGNSVSGRRTVERGNVNAQEEVMTVLYIRSWKYSELARRFLSVIIFALSFFSLASPASMAAEIAFPFTVKAGLLYRGEEVLKCEIHEILGNKKVACWCLLESELHGVTEEEAGIWFFSADGKVSGRVPYEAGLAKPEIYFSPDNSRYVISEFSASRPDGFFHVIGENGEEIAQLEGLRDSLRWVDPIRFVYTSIDDLRENGVGTGMGYALMFSVVMYDTAKEAPERTVLKQADATRSFCVSGLTGDGGSIVIQEISVATEKDWDDENKIRYNEITVKIPAAG